MAKLRTPPTVAAITGTVGGLTFKRSRWGTIVYQKPHRRPANTTLALATRLAFNRIADRWHYTLTPPQRTAWERYAATELLPFNTTRTAHMTGYNAYLQHHLPWAFYPPWWIDDPPATPHTARIPDWRPYFNDRSHIIARYNYDPLVGYQASTVTLTTPFATSPLSPRFWSYQSFHNYSPLNYPVSYTLAPPHFPGQHVYILCRRLDRTARFSPWSYHRLLWP